MDNQATCASEQHLLPSAGSERWGSGSEGEGEAFGTALAVRRLEEMRPLLPPLREQTESRWATRRACGETLRWLPLILPLPPARHGNRNDPRAATATRRTRPFFCITHVE